jgi:hypothetical protein
MDSSEVKMSFMICGRNLSVDTPTPAVRWENSTNEGTLPPWLTHSAGILKLQAWIGCLWQEQEVGN